MFKKLLITIIAFTSFNSFAQQSFEGCKHYFAFNFIPTIADSPELKLRTLCFDSFAVLHSGSSKTPLYSAQVLTKERLEDALDEKRTNQFYPEARLPSKERARLEDYSGSSFDRGHLSPAADMPNKNAMAQSFSLANIVPQDSTHNRGLWADVEKATRQYVKRSASEVYVITGPVFDYKPHQKVKTIGNGVWVPTHMFKLVYDKSQRRAWAFWSENSSKAKMDKPITYKQLVQYTGVEFLPDYAFDRILPNKFEHLNDSYKTIVTNN